MNNYFECKVKYDRIDESGVNKSVTEAYLIEAISHADAENRIIEEMKAYVSGELLVTSVRRQKIAEIFGLDDDGNENRWYKTKINFVSIDEEKGTEKRTPSTMFVKSDDIEKALGKVQAGMKNTMADYEIAAIVETQVIDYYPYSEQQEGTAFYDDDTDFTTEADNR